MVGEGAAAGWMDEKPSHDGGDLFLRGRSAADWEPPELSTPVRVLKNVSMSDI